MPILCLGQVQMSTSCIEYLSRGGPGISVKKGKCTLNQQKLCGKKRSDIWIWCPYLVQAKSNCFHHIQNIGAWEGISVKNGKCALNQQKLPREKEKTSKHNIYTLSRQSQAVSTTYKIFGYGKPWELYQKRKCTLNQ